jgi:hypothetical protein
VDEPTLSMTAKPIDADDELVQPTAVFSEPPKVFSSVVFPVIEAVNSNVAVTLVQKTFSIMTFVLDGLSLNEICSED